MDPSGWALLAAKSLNWDRTSQQPRLSRGKRDFRSTRERGFPRRLKAATSHFSLTLIRLGPRFPPGWGVSRRLPSLVLCAVIWPCSVGVKLLVYIRITKTELTSRLFEIQKGKFIRSSLKVSASPTYKPNLKLGHAADPASDNGRSLPAHRI